MEQHYFVTYLPLSPDIDDEATIEQWIERITFIREDLTWLLQQNHTKFWCEVRIMIRFLTKFNYLFKVAFNKDFHSMFDSYLRYAPR
jgi:hypothetical protein